jgi:hypothetical integral membrane protein (TIGR02206 family)
LIFSAISANLCLLCGLRFFKASNVSADFHLFCPLHLSILAAIPMAAAVLAAATRRHPNSARATRIALAWVLAADGLIWYAYRYSAQGVRFPDLLPLELCDVSFWLTVGALLTLEEHTFDLAYYWGIAGSGMALLTPYLREPLRTFQSFQYFTGHSLLIIGVLYLIWSGQARPRLRSWWFAWWTLNVYGVVVAVVDFLGGTNFMYLRQKPASSSLFDALGPWPWYILGADFVALVLFRLMQFLFSSRNRAEILHTSRL